MGLLYHSCFTRNLWFRFLWGAWRKEADYLLGGPISRQFQKPGLFRAVDNVKFHTAQSRQMLRFLKEVPKNPGFLSNWQLSQSLRESCHNPGKGLSNDKLWAAVSKRSYNFGLKMHILGQEGGRNCSVGLNLCPPGAGAEWWTWAHLRVSSSHLHDYWWAINTPETCCWLQLPVGREGEIPFLLYTYISATIKFFLHWIYITVTSIIYKYQRAPLKVSVLCCIKRNFCRNLEELN